MTMRRCELQIRDARFLVPGDSSQPQHPAHRRRHGSNDVLAEPRSDAGIVAIIANCEQLLSPSRRFLGVVQRRQVAFFDKRGVIRLQPRRQSKSKESVAIFWISREPDMSQVCWVVAPETVLDMRRPSPLYP